MDDSGTGSGKTPAPSMRKLRKAMKDKMKQTAAQSEGSVGCLDGAGDGPVGEEDPVVASAVKKRKTQDEGGCGMVDTGDRTKGNSSTGDGTKGKPSPGEDNGADKRMKEVGGEEAGSSTNCIGDGRAGKEVAVVAPSAKKRKTKLDRVGCGTVDARDGEMEPSIVVAHTPHMPQR